MYDTSTVTCVIMTVTVMAIPLSNTTVTSWQHLEHGGDPYSNVTVAMTSTLTVIIALTMTIAITEPLLLIQLHVSVNIMLLFSRLILLCCSCAASRNSTGTLPTTAPTTARSKKRQGGPLNRFIRQLRKLNKHNSNSNSTCEELKGCQRICVGQNEQLTNVSDCSTFKIHCTSRKLFRRSTKNKSQKAKNKKP